MLRSNLMAGWPVLRAAAGSRRPSPTCCDRGSGGAIQQGVPRHEPGIHRQNATLAAARRLNAGTTAETPPRPVPSWRPVPVAECVFLGPTQRLHLVRLHAGRAGHDQQRREVDQDDRPKADPDSRLSALMTRPPAGKQVECEQQAHGDREQEDRDGGRTGLVAGLHPPVDVDGRGLRLEGDVPGQQDQRSELADRPGRRRARSRR